MKETVIMDIEVELKVSTAYLAKLTSELLKADDYAAKHNARLTLVKIGKRALPAMHRLLSDKSAAQRMEAAKIVQLISDSRSIPFLIKLLDDPEFEIRWIASEGLVKTGRKCIVPVLRSIRGGKSSLFIAKSAHHVLDALLLENEKVQLNSLLQVLENHHETSETAPVEAAKALRVFLKLNKISSQTL
jgi:HEAT repeat protein